MPSFFFGTGRTLFKNSNYYFYLNSEEVYGETFSFISELYFQRGDDFFINNKDTVRRKRYVARCCHFQTDKF